LEKGETMSKLAILLAAAVALVMIKLPRACVRADEIAEHADFFSFGTNDLTQTTLGFSRDDAEGTFLTFYFEDGALERTRSRRSTRAAWATSCGSPSSAGGACRTT
jgi:hypothetical protein